jgi:hypothetical protein
VTVYVDDAQIPAKVGRYRARWSHLFTDSADFAELHEFAAGIGLLRSWFQRKPGSRYDFSHYDVTEAKRQAAIAAGAVEVSWVDTPGILSRAHTARRAGEVPPVPADTQQWECDHCRPVDWVIAGGESGPGARPVDPGWVRSLRDQCQAVGCCFFFKQWGAWRPASVTDPPPRPCRYIEDPAPMVRVGKHAAGRDLDGRTWDERPEVTR